jgi:hypothetical protein
MDQFLGEQQRYRRDDDEDVGRTEVLALQAAEDDSEEEVKKEKNEGDPILQPHVKREARVPVMLSPFAALTVNYAKHLQYLLENKPMQIPSRSLP